MEFDITEAMRNWQNGDPNYGVLLMATNEDDEILDSTAMLRQTQLVMHLSTYFVTSTVRTV